jgi:hypothetical protein
MHSTYLQLKAAAQVIAEQKVWQAKMKVQEEEHQKLLKDAGVITPDMEAGVRALM